MRYRIGLSVFDAGRVMGSGKIEFYDVTGAVRDEPPPWVEDARRDISPQSGIEDDGGDFQVYWCGEASSATIGDWIAHFPETGALLVLSNELFEQLMPMPVHYEVIAS